MSGTTIHINRKRFETEAGSMTGREVLALGGFADDHDLFLLVGEGDRTGGSPIGLDQEVEIRPGMHFRAIPSNRNFG